MNPLFNRLSPYRPEIELLLCCTHTQADGRCQERIATLARIGLNWSYVWALMYRNRVQALSYLNLQAACAQEVPVEMLHRLKVAYQQIGLKNLSLSAQLLQVLACLAQEGIQALPYKGVALAEQLYGSIGLRSCLDVDLLVRQEDVLAARAILCAAGFVQTWPQVELTKAQEVAHLQSKYNYSLAHPQYQTKVELHWGITPNYLRCPPDHAWLWARVEEGRLAGHPIWIFPVEELLLILCVHGSNHCWDRLCWIGDIAELLRRHESTLQWEHVESLAHRWHAERMLLLGLFLAHALLDAPLPAAVQQKIAQHPQIVLLAKASCRHLFCPKYLPFAPFEEPFYHLKMRERWVDQLHYLLANLTPSTKDRLWLPLPTSLHFLYVLLRPLRLGFEHGFRLRS